MSPNEFGRWQRFTSLFNRGAGTAGPDDSGHPHTYRPPELVEPTDHTDDHHDYTSEIDEPEQEADWLGAEAADAGANADAAAAFGSNYAGLNDARAEWAAADERRPTLSPALRHWVTHYETRKDRPITEAELRWLEHLAAEEGAPADTARPAPNEQDRAALQDVDDTTRDEDGTEL